MSTDQLREYFRKSKSDNVYIECLTFTHPDFSQDYNIVRNKVDGYTYTNVHGTTVYEYYPVQIDYDGLQNDVDFGITISFGDLGTIIQEELANMPTSFITPSPTQGMAIKPLVNYNAFASETDTPLLGVTGLRLEVSDIQSNHEGSVIKATTRRANINKAGSRYNFAQFPMLRGYV